MEGSADTAAGTLGRHADVDARWRELAQGALKGAPLESLRGTSDGLTLDCFFSAAEPLYSGRAQGGRWQVVQRVDRSDGAAAQAADDLLNGADALEIVFAGAPLAHKAGLPPATLGELDAALQGVLLEHCAIHLHAGALGPGAMAQLLALAGQRGVRPAALHAGIDPLGTLFALGAAPAPRIAGACLRTFAAAKVPGTALLADGRPVAEAGGTAVSEVAFALASLTAYLRAAEAEGLAADAALPLVAMGFSASQDQFTTIAKLRAARRLHALVARSCGANAPVRLHVTTLARMMSASDPHTNLLRLTVAAFGAGVGGADSLCVLPFDGRAGGFPRRQSRNIQSLLLEEAHVAAFADPAAGAGALEALTDAIAEAAWARFQQVDDDPLQAITSGAWHEEVAANDAAARAALEADERAIIGVTRHRPETPAPVPTAVEPAAAAAPDAAPRDVDALLAAARSGAPLSELIVGAPVTAPASPPARLSAPFEG